MFLRLLGCSLLLAGIAAWLPRTAPYAAQNVAQTKENAAGTTKWEYKVVRVPGQCSSENDLSAALDAYGRLGWEMVSFERIVPFPKFPKEAQGTLLIQPAATGPGAAVNPPTADSFTGTITMKMIPDAEPPRPEVCRVYFKRAVAL
jgi:hypothetical protein